MLSGGDEFGRTQQGNNNAYCQDNEMSWLDWNWTPQQKELVEFTRYVIELRKEQRVLRRRKFFQGRSIRGVGVKDIAWYEPRGREMADKAWGDPFARCLGVLLNGNTLDEIDERGEPVIGDTLFLMFNAHHDAILFRLPVKQRGRKVGASIGYRRRADQDGFIGSRSHLQDTRQVHSGPAFAACRSYPNPPRKRRTSRRSGCAAK